MPFLGMMPTQLVDESVDINGGAIDGTAIGASSAAAGTFTNLTATGTLTLPDDGISGDDVNGGTISNFASTGIDDNATSTAITIDSSQNVGVGTSSPTSVYDKNVHINGATSCGLRLSSGTYTSGFDVVSASDGNAYLLNRNNTNMIFSTNGNERMRIDTSGNLLVGTTSTASGPGGIMILPNVSNGSGLIDIDRTSTTATSEAFLVRNGGSVVGKITYNNTTTTYATSSDYRLKENIVALNNGIDRLKQIPVHRFNFIANPDITVDGFLAHEVQDVVPEAITGTKDEVDDKGNPVYQGIDQSKLVPLLTAALQEALTKIESLETRLSALEAN